jgi:hypothetical protein
MLMNKICVGLVEGFDRTVRGGVEPLVPEDAFYKVQSKLHRASPTPKGAYRKDNPEFTLRRVVLCPRCGHLLAVSPSKGNGASTGTTRARTVDSSDFAKNTWNIASLRYSPISVSRETMQSRSG